MMDDVLLIADDNAPTRDLMAAILKDEGYPILQAEDGGAAIKITEDHHVVCLPADNSPRTSP